MIGAAARSLERFLLPNVCIVCEGSIPHVTPDDLVCPICCSRMRALPRGCERCRHPLPPVGPCRFCAPWCSRLEWVMSAVWLGKEVRRLIHHLKYRRAPGLARLAGSVIAHRLPRPRGYLVPVPAGSRRLRVRGYNQAALIARDLGRRWRLPVAESLSRRREAPSQTALTPEARLANVAGAFHASRPPRAVTEARTADRDTPGPLASAIVVDDVLTTGATIDAAARALAHAGWPSVGAVTLARAMPYDLRMQ